MKAVNRIGFGSCTRLPSTHAARHPRVVRARKAHDKRALFLLDGLEEVNARIPAVREQQATLQGRCIRKKLSLGFFVGRELDGADLVGETAIRGM